MISGVTSKDVSSSPDMIPCTSSPSMIGYVGGASRSPATHAVGLCDLTQPLASRTLTRNSGASSEASLGERKYHSAKQPRVASCMHFVTWRSLIYLVRLRSCYAHFSSRHICADQARTRSSLISLQLGGPYTSRNNRTYLPNQLVLTQHHLSPISHRVPVVQHGCLPETGRAGSSRG